MKTIVAYTGSNIYPLTPDEVKITRRYEEKEYAFVAGDLQLTVKESDVYDLVRTGEEVFVLVKNDDDARFLGVCQREGAGWDTEKEAFTLPALHIAKKVFEDAKNWRPNQKLSNAVVPTRIPTVLIGAPAFDAVIANTLGPFPGCSISLVVADFEYARTVFDNPDKTFNDFLLATGGYAVRDYWMDWSRHYRAVMSVGDALDANGLPVLTVASRRKLSNIIHLGYDNLLAGYSEENHDPDYPAIVFPCAFQLKIHATDARPASQVAAYCIYRQSGPELHYTGNPFTASTTGRTSPPDGLDVPMIGHGGEQIFTPPEDALDMRVPPGIYGDKYPTFLPFGSVPTFIWCLEDVDWVGEDPIGYCERHFFMSVRAVKEITALYSQQLAVNPCETINIHGSNAVITEIEDDEVNETTQVIARVAE